MYKIRMLQKEAQLMPPLETKFRWWGTKLLGLRRRSIRAISVLNWGR